MKVQLMNSRRPARASTTNVSGLRPLLRVMLLYEDFATGARAKAIFDHLRESTEVKADFSLDLWRFNLLEDQELNQRAAESAAAADLVVFSAHGHGDLPGEVQMWLFHWLQKAGSQATALVVSLDGALGEYAGQSRTLAFLRSLAKPIGVEVFAHFGEPVAGGQEWTTDWVEQRVHAKSSLLDGILHHQSPYAHWGLNE